MKKRIKKNKGPIEKIKIVKDFLPPPEKLVLKEKAVTVSLSLPESSVAYFKKRAKKLKVSYEAMLSKLLQKWAHKDFPV